MSKASASAVAGDPDRKVVLVKGAGLLSRTYRTLARTRALTARSLAISPAVRQWTDARYDSRRVRHADSLPTIPQADVDLVAELERSSVASRSFRPPDDVLASADDFVERLRHTESRESCVRISPAEHATDPTVFAWGLQPELLDLAECYIGLPVRYLGAEVKRERPYALDRNDDVLRQWHTDHEDRRMLKVIVYLSDVDVASGPFEYLDRRCTERAMRAVSFRRGDGAPADTVIDEVVPQSERCRLTGPRLTAVYADTSRVLHRVMAPVTTDRYSMTFVYASTALFYAYPHFMLPRKALTQLRHQLTARQQRALTMA